MFGGIVLAAGASTRLGSPKALLPLKDGPAVEYLAKALKKAGCRDVVVVLGADRDLVEPWVPKWAHLVINDHWNAGRTRSVKSGVLRLPHDVGIVVWPVDHPAVRFETIKKLLVEASPGIRIPTYQGRRGHPVVFGAGLRNEILALGDDEPLHDVLHAPPERVTEVPVEDQGVLFNVDTPQDVAKLAHFIGGA